MYRVILADPPWQYNDKLTMSDTRRSSDSHYSTMTVEDIVNFQIPPTATDALLFLWVTNPFLLDGSGPRVCKAWGFEPKQLVTWVKGASLETPQMGLGHYTRGVTEQLIVGVKGHPKHYIKDRGVLNLLVAPRGAHSVKPEAAHEMIERLIDGPYCELFARRQRAGWTCLGEEMV
jgi:N6-adenosine-specific RNA methylase IME4